MRIPTILILMGLSYSYAFSQQLEVEGPVSLPGLQNDLIADSIVTINNNGSLGKRAISTFTSDLDSLNEIQAFSVSATGDTLFLTKGNWIIVPGISVANQPTPDPTCSAEGEIIVTEIMANPSSVNDVYGEWFELYNTSMSPIDINGWNIADNGSNNHTINHGGPLMIPAMSYLVLGNNADSMTNGGVTVDYEYNNFSLTNIADQIILSCDALQIDSVGYGSILTIVNGVSISLSPDHLSGSANDDESNWCLSTSDINGTEVGTPGSANDACIAPVSGN
ncbi:MAG: lamin tail domain-containing protein [Saprospiraceae bacterium]|nr:lamin tail domain-containing protein [Saprospiraceae bacterium]